MADKQKVEYIIELLKQGDGGEKAAQELEKLGKQGDKTESALSRLTGTAKGFFAALGGVVLLEKALGQFVEAEQAVQRLDGALKSSGQYTKEYSEEMQGLADSLSKVTAYGDEAILNVISKLVAFGAPKEGLPQLTEAVLDLSTLMEKDLPRATVAMARALKGEFGAFQELGFKFDDAANTGQKLKSVMEQVGRTAGGQARGAVESLGGEIENTKKQWMEFLEQLGRVVAPVAVALSKVLSELSADNHPSTEKVKAQMATYTAMREELEATIRLQRELGVISEADAERMFKKFGTAWSALNEQIQGKGGRPDEVAALFPMLRRATDDVREELSTGKPPSRGLPPKPPFDWETYKQVEEEKAARLEIGKLQESMRGDEVEGLEKERLAVGSLYAERLRGIEKQTNLARSSAEEIAQLQGGALAAYENKLRELDEKSQEESSKRAMRNFEEKKAVAAAETDLINQTLASQLKGLDAELFQAQVNHQQRVAQLRELKFEDEDRYIRLMDLEEQLYVHERQRLEQEHSAANRLKLDMVQVGEQAEQQAAGGISHAFSAFVTGTKDADQAFQEFGANFLATIADMIMQVILLNAIKAGVSAVFSGFGGGNLTSSQISAGESRLAGGGIRFAAAGMMGMTDGPTFLPKHGVIAGEAGPEMLAVLAKPYQAFFGGMPAMVGSVGGRQMAIADAQSLFRVPGPSFNPGGMGGSAEIVISLSQGLEGRIVRQALAAR